MPRRHDKVMIIEQFKQHLLTPYLALFLAAAAILPQLQAGEARIFEGVDLSQLREVEQLRAMPEIYRMNPETRRFELRDGAFHIPLGAAWLIYNPKLKVWYLNKVPGENEASYFGPVFSDPFEVFKLEERMLTKLRKDYDMDVLYRLRLMLRSGDAQMRERMLRIMTGALASDIRADLRTSNAGEFRKMLSDLKGEDVAPVLAAIQQTEKQLEELTVAIPEDQYLPGNETLEKLGKLQDWMKVPVPVPDGAWGELVNGLRAAAVFSTTAPKVGEKINVWLLAQNAGDHEIRFAVSDVTQTARPSIKRPDGTTVEEKSAWFTGLSPILRYKLKPGEKITLARKTLVFDNRQNADALPFGENRAVAGAGEYLVGYEPIAATGSSWSHDKTGGGMRRTYPAKGEWSGSLVSGETRLTVAEPEAAAAPAAPARP